MKLLGKNKTVSPLKMCRLYMDAIKGMSIDTELCMKYVPSSYYTVTDKDGGIDFNTEAFLTECLTKPPMVETDLSGTKQLDVMLDLYRMDALKSLYELLQFSPEVKGLYEGFEPMCDAERLYREYMSRFIERERGSRMERTEKVNTNFSDTEFELPTDDDPPMPVDFENMYNVGRKYLSNQASDVVNFGIIHRLGCEFESLKEALVEKDFLPEQCFISTEEMEAETEKRKTSKFFEVLKALGAFDDIEAE